MSKASTNPGLFRRLLSRPAPADVDAADLGTCIGLEFSLDPPDYDPVAPDSAPRQAPGWVQRLTARARTAR